MKIEIEKTDLKTMFAKASKSFIEANPAILTHPEDKNELQTLPRLHKPRSINKTEAEFAAILEAQKRRGEILRYEYEGITLRWAGMRYTPDFVVVARMCHTWAENDPQRKNPPWQSFQFKLIEVKGAHIWPKDIVRFKGARAYWLEFTFEMHQRTKSGWTQLL